MASSTTHYNLTKPELSDIISPTVFANNFDLIDAALNTLAESGISLATGSYSGTGTYGSSNPNTLTFDFEPKFLFIASASSDYADLTTSTGSQSNGIWIDGWNRLAYFQSAGAMNTRIFTKTGNTISWYAHSSNSPDQYTQLNGSGNTYYYIALG